VWLAIGASSDVGAHVGPEGVLVYHVTILAPANTTLPGQTIDGISCRKEARETVK
jgi:hypothetical protein